MSSLDEAILDSAMRPALSFLSLQIRCDTGRHVRATCVNSQVSLSRACA